jgi:hypothetical protein
MTPATQAMLDATVVLEALRPAAQVAPAGSPIREAFAAARAALEKACTEWLATQ